MEERRKIDRVAYGADSVIVVRDDLSKIYCKVKNISPLGMAVSVKSEVPPLVGKDVIIVADTLIMYADIVREDKEMDGTTTVALSARKFTGEVLDYLFEHIALD